MDASVAFTYMDVRLKADPVRLNKFYSDRRKSIRRVRVR